MTQELEHTLRCCYGGLVKNELIDHCIELQKKIEILEFHMAASDVSNILHDVAVKIKEEMNNE